MSNEFYNYLAKKTIQYFNSIDIKNGDRFIVQFEKEDEVKSLYEEIKKETNYDEFSYIAKDGEEEYNTYSFLCNGINVIVAATINGIQSGYLTLLRNCVGKDSVVKDSVKVFENTAILFIHNSRMDSILNGAISLKNEGMPFHPFEIIKDLETDLNRSPLEEFEKTIIQFQLEKNNYSNNGLFLQFKELLQIVNKNKIEEEDYKNFGLFKDDQLKDYNPKKRIERLKKNSEIYRRIENIHKNYADISNELDKFLDSNGVEKLSNPNDWDDMKFEKVIQSINNKSNTKLKYEKYTLINIDEKNFWDKPNSTSKAGERTRNMIIFNPDKETVFKFTLDFEQKIQIKSPLAIKGDGIKAKISGEKIKVEINHELDTVLFYNIKLKSVENYEFKIVILDMDRSLFEGSIIEYGYNIKNNRIIIDTNNSEIILNKDQTETEKFEIISQDQSIDIEDLTNRIEILNQVTLDEDKDSVNINLNIENITIPFSIKDEGQKAIKISGYNVWVKKREEKKDFKYTDEKLIQGTMPYFATDEFRINLVREEKIIKLGGMAFNEQEGELEEIKLELPNDLTNAYAALINYYKVNGILPSLAYYNSELTKIAFKYVEEFIKILDGIKDKEDFRKLYKDLSLVGSIKVESGNQQILFTPLHPLNIIYQLQLNKEIKSEKLVENLSRKLDSLYLLPYIAEYKIIYKPLEQNHSPEWKYYIKNSTKKYRSTRKFVAKLIKEKIEEFVKHFPYLFNMSNRPEIKINLINTGDSKEILQGIINYYVGQLKNKVDEEKLISVYINIYSEEDNNVFEELSYYETVNEIEENLEIKFDVTSLNKNYSKEDILSICRDKIKFFKRDVKSDVYEYCHLAFYEMNQNIEERDTKMNEMITGVSLNGLLSGSSSKYINDSYRSGFGSKFMDNSESNLLLKLSKKLNALNRSIYSESSFDNLECKTTIISNNEKEYLNKIYDSSNWVTFIEPKFDLNFLKSDDESKDVLIIHYSDQYTSSSGYDAITVTKKCEQYMNLIKEFLLDKKINIDDRKIADVINCFNAINGDWLLKILKGNNDLLREKLSLISAMKLSLSYFYHKDIIWVPISLEEILRVSRGAGLNSSDGLFSVKNLNSEGSFSDDLLLIGIENDNDNIKIHYYPVEVKVGKGETDRVKKAKKQLYKTRNYFEKHMIELDNENETRRFTKKMYRNFMMQLVIISAEKMKLYNIWNEQNWNSVINSELRLKLLNDDYEIVNNLDSLIGRGAFIFFKDESIYNEYKVTELSKDDLKDEEFNEVEFEKGNRFVQLTFTENIAYNYIVKSITEIKNGLLSDNTDISINDLIINKYNKSFSNNNSNKVEKIEVNESRENSCSYNSNMTNRNLLKEESSTPTYSPKITIGKGILDEEDILYDPKRVGDPLSNMNIMITGSSGKGKSQLLKSMIIEQRKQGTNFLIFDFKNDFGDKEFLEMANLKNVNLEFKGLPYNPLIPPIKEDDGVKLINVGEHILALAGVFKQVYKLGSQQEVALKNSFRKIYKENGINPRLNEIDENEIISYPVIDDIADILEESDEKAYSRLDTLFNYGLFRSKSRDISLVELLNDSYVFNLSSISNDEVKNTIAKIIVVSAHQYINTLPHSPNDIKNVFVFDEAHRFLGEPSLTKLARECRAYGLAIWLSSQYPSDYPEEIRGCLETKIIHGNGDDAEKIKDIKKLINYDGDDNNLAKLGLFQAIFNNTHYSKKFINTIAFPHLLLLNEIDAKGNLRINDIESIDKVRREEVINYLVKLDLICRDGDVIRIK